MALKAGGPAITVQERVYPRHPVVGTCCRNQGALPTVHRTIYLIEALQERGQGRGRWWNMASYLYLARSDLAWNDDFSIVRNTVIGTQTVIQRPMRCDQKVRRQSGVVAEVLFQFSLGLDMGNGNALQTSFVRFVGKIVLQRPLNVMRVRTLAFNAIAVVRIHLAHELPQSGSGCFVSSSGQLD